MNYNRMILGGRLTRDPELRHIPSGTALCEVGLAVNTKRKDGDKWVDGDPLFIDLKCWGARGEALSKHFKKGDAIFVEGELRLESWEDKEGKKRSRHTVLVSEWQFVLPRRGSESSGPPPGRNDVGEGVADHVAKHRSKEDSPF